MTIDVRAREINWLGVVERSVATAAQAFLATWMVADVETAKAAGIAAVAAGLSVLKNAVRDWVTKVEKA